MNHIILTPQTAKLVKEVVVKEVSLVDFLNSINNNVPLSMPILPNNTRGFVSGEINTSFIVEQFPRKFTMNFDSNTDLENIQFDLYLPYIYYKINIQNNPVLIQNVYMAYSTTPIKDLKSNLGTFPTPNIDFRSNPTKGGLVCLGEVKVSDNLPIHELVADLITKILSSNFNQDLFEPKDNCPTMFEKAITKYTTKIMLEKDKDNEVAKYLLTNNNSQIKYLYAWSRLTKSMSLSEFMNKLKFKTKITYQDYLNSEVSQ